LPVVRLASISRWASPALPKGTTLLMPMTTVPSATSANERSAMEARRSGLDSASAVMLNPASCWLRLRSSAGVSGSSVSPLALPKAQACRRGPAPPRPSSVRPRRVIRARARQIPPRGLRHPARRSSGPHRARSDGRRRPSRRLRRRATARAPRCRAIWPSAIPAPPAAAVTTTVSPRPTRPSS
jgi:hypothetical protein